MAWMNAARRAMAIVGIVGGFALARVPALAQTNAPASSPAQGSGLMRGMSNGQGGMMMNPGMQQQMSRMMDNCNRMMESTMQNKDRTGAPAAPTNKG